MEKPGGGVSGATAPVSAAQKLQQAHTHFRFRQFKEAEAVLKSLLKISPASGDLLHFMAAVQGEMGQVSSAVENLQKAIKLSPGNANYFFTLGSTFANARQDGKAIEAYREAVRLNPSLSEAWFNLGNLLRVKPTASEAVQAYQTAIKIKPEFAEAHSNLGDAYKLLGQFDDAIASYECALKCKPDAAQTYSNMGLVRQLQGKIEQAIGCYAKALEIQPDFASAASNQLMALQYFHRCTADEVFAKHVQFGQRFEARLKAGWPAHHNNPDPTRRIKLGYVSPDLREHSVAAFIRPVLRDQDRSAFEVFAYYSNQFRDKVTEELEGMCDHWIQCGDMNDEALANRVLSDGIDILVDLSGHTGGNRLLAFARKPAPIQVTWIGYPGTTGLTAMDYRVTDGNLDPVGVTDSQHTEQLLRLPTMTPFTPSPDSPAVNELPALSQPIFTFASLNNLSKLNESVIETWSTILKLLPSSRLILGNANDPQARQWMLGLFEHFGISADRLVLKNAMAKSEYLALHNEIDLGLDPYPYNGGTTTLHSLWMGVPVVTLRGDRAAALQGASTLTYAGVPQFIAEDLNDYVQIALRYANDLPALNAVRQQVRSHMASNQQNVCEATVRPLERLYREIWVKWCEKQKAAAI